MMAEQGKTLPLSTKMEIRRRRGEGESVRRIADDLGLNKNTVSKYGRPSNNLGTKLLNENEKSF